MAHVTTILRLRNRAGQRPSSLYVSAELLAQVLQSSLHVVHFFNHDFQFLHRTLLAHVVQLRNHIVELRIRSGRRVPPFLLRIRMIRFLLLSCEGSPRNITAYTGRCSSRLGWLSGATR